MKKIEKFTFGMGDRFAHQGEAQMKAILDARADGIDVFPVWNKSNREHLIVGSRPESLRAEADAAVNAAGWDNSYYVDADHVNLKTVDGFLAHSDFFTLDVADQVGKPADREVAEAFVEAHRDLYGSLAIPGLDEELKLTEADARSAAERFLEAIREAGRIYRHIKEKKSGDDFVVEVSIDETDAAQTPADLLFILAMIARERIPAQTVAPKFTGRFNKGVDYVGDLEQFEKEFAADLAIVRYAVDRFGLPDTLKLSVHSGSDKFSLYPVINRLLKKFGAGVHVKTAGTTWLEEVIGLAEAGNDGLEIAKAIYSGAHAKFDELTAPYATVIDIDFDYLPRPAEVAQWNSQKFVAVLRHDPGSSEYNQHFRQLIHVGFKVAASMGDRYTDALQKHEPIIAANVTANLLERHIRPIFG
jgi:tagaturonate epimerase